MEKGNLIRGHIYKAQSRFLQLISLGKHNLALLGKHNLASLGKHILALFSFRAKGPKTFKYLPHFDRKI